MVNHLKEIENEKIVSEQWSCEVCHKRYDTEEEAKRCENREPELKELIKKYGQMKNILDGYKTNDWQIGDIVIIDEHDYDLRFGKIVDTEVIRHKVTPVIEKIHNGEELIDLYSGYYLVSDEQLKRLYNSIKELVDKRELLKKKE